VNRMVGTRRQERQPQPAPAQRDQAGASVPGCGVQASHRPW
jgi:hypothetical protein